MLGFFPARAWPLNTWPELPEAEEFLALGTWAIEELEADAERALFRLADAKTRLEVKLPARLVTLEEFPAADPAALGARLPLVYGLADGVPALLVDASTNTFCTAGHEITRLRGVWIGDAAATPEDIDLEAATFRLPAWSFEQGDVTVDLEGKPHAEGGSIRNPADVLADLIAVEAGEVSGLDLDALEAARAAWLLGYDAEGLEVHRYEIGLAITQETTAAELVARVALAGFGLVYQGGEASFKVRAWNPSRPVGALRLADSDLFGLDAEVVYSEVVTRYRVSYRKHPVDKGLAQLLTVESEEARRELGLAAHVEEAVELPFYHTRCAEAWASRALAMRSRPARRWTVETHGAAMALEPGDVVQLYASALDAWGTRRPTVDALVEVLQIEREPATGKVVLLVSDLRGIGSRAAFIMSGGEELPEALGGGPAAPFDTNWTEAARRYALERFAYVSDSRYFIDPLDAKTWRASAVI